MEEPAASKLDTSRILAQRSQNKRPVGLSGNCMTFEQQVTGSGDD